MSASSSASLTNNPSTAASIIVASHPSFSPSATASTDDKPSQIRFFRPAQMALFAQIQTYPPLSQVSIIPPSRKQFNFTVVLESSQSLPQPPWEVSIWYDHGAYSGTKGPWKALDLSLVDPGPFVLFDDSKSKHHRYTFSGNLDSPFPAGDRIHRGRRVPFTVRYRIDQHSEWQWVYHNFNIPDGELILQPPVDPNFLGVSPVDLWDGWSTRKLTSEAPEARLYSFESSDTIPAAHDGTDAHLHTKALGRVLNLHRWFALVRIWKPWLGPRHGESRFHLTEPALMASFLRSDGLHVVILAVNGIDDVLTTFASGHEGEILVQARNDTTEPRKFRVLAACGWKFEVAMASVMYEMRKQVRSSPTYLDSLQHYPQEVLRANSISSESEYAMVTSDTHPHHHQQSSNNNTNGTTSPTPTFLTSWYDSLAYCTWNSLGQRLTSTAILSALDSFASQNIHFSTLIIDDNWQSLTGSPSDNQFHRGWTDFEANPEGFPDGLKSFVTTLRERYPQLKDIAVWHALMGYWGLIAPDSPLSKRYATEKVHLDSATPAGGEKLAISPDSIREMYDDFYAFLADCGVTAVKTDVQFYLDSLTSTQQRRRFAAPYLSAWTQAHLKHLQGKAISCMSMTPQILFGQFLPTTGPRVLLRTSDDFFPDVEQSHRWHVFANAHNMCLVRYLNVVVDWDMFQTRGEKGKGGGDYSGMHAAARCVSGGAVYLTDEPGRGLDVGLVNQMCARGVGGEKGKAGLVVLRPSTVGRSVGVYDRYEERGVLKVGCWDGGIDGGSGILGVFNMGEGDCSFVLPVTKFPGVEGEDEGLQSVSRRGSEYEKRGEGGGGSGSGSGNGNGRLSSGPSSVLAEGGGSWVVRSHVSGRVTRPIRPTVPLKSEALLQGRLGKGGYDVWTARPVSRVEMDDGGEVEVTVLGLLGKFTGACAITGCDIVGVEGRSKVKVAVSLKALGVLGIWVSDVDGAGGDGGKERWNKDDMMVLIQGRAVPVETVEVSAEGIGKGDHARIIRVDVERAWDEMELDSGWSNEVRVEIFFQ